MALTFGSIPLVLPTEEVLAWVAANISQKDIPIFTRRAFPGANLTKLTFPTGFYPMTPIRLNRLYWYTGASRWGYGHFLCDKNQLQQIQTLAMGSNCQQMNALTLTISDGNGGTISPQMYLGYETPLSGIRGVNGMYMITLVDARYYWWWVSTPDFAIDSGTVWDDLYADCQGKLGQAISRDPVDPDYYQPSPSLNLQYEAFPLVLDAIAYNCGQRITLDFGGKIRAINYANSQTAFTANLNTPFISKRAGDVRFGSTL
jgi:hypothetical protein